MNKLKVTKSNIRNNNYRIVKVGYCEMQSMLRFKEPIAYSSGIYGWSCDYYEIDNVVISSGYQPLENKNVNCDYDLIKKYEKQARKVIDSDIDYSLKIKKIDKLWLKFLKECKGEQ